MKGFIEKALNAAKKFNVWDFGLFKICLFSLGIIFGVYFNNFFLAYIQTIWVLFIATWVWLLYKTFFKYWK